jgi:hypothetical protein
VRHFFTQEAQLKNIAAWCGRDPLLVDKLLSAPPGSGHCRTASTARSEGPVWPMKRHSKKRSFIGEGVTDRTRRWSLPDHYTTTLATAWLPLWVRILAGVSSSLSVAFPISIFIGLFTGYLSVFIVFLFQLFCGRTVERNQQIQIDAAQINHVDRSHMSN